MRPNAMEIGNAGRACRNMASRINVKQSPIRIATKQANVVFQSPEAEALPTRTLWEK